jgi:hypothetical protein
MALSSQSKTFVDAKKELENKIVETGSADATDVSNIANKYGITVEDFKQANSELKKMQEAGFDTTSGEYSIADAPGKFVGEGVGFLVEGVGRLGETFLPDPALNAISKAADAVGEYIPDSVKKAAQATLDPYHGEGLMADIQEGSAQIAATLLPVGKITQLGKAAASTGMGSNILARTYARLGAKGKMLAKGGAYGAAFATADTLISDPRKSLVDIINASVFEDPQAIKALEKLSENPDDPTATDYLNSFIENLALEGTVGGLGYLGGSLVKRVADSYKANKFAKTKQFITKLGEKTKQNFSSRMGTEDVTLADLIKRDTAAETAIIKADGYAKDLEKSIKDNLSNVIEQNPNYPSEVIDKALKGDMVSMERLIADSPEVAGIVTSMRKEITDLSTKFRDKAAKGKLYATIDNNLGVYMNRSYDIFDNPKYMKEIQKRVAARGQGENVADDVVNNAAQYIARQKRVAIDDPIVQDTLEKLVKTQDKDAFADFIESISAKNKLKSSSKPLMNKKNIDVSIRDLWGEVKDPTKNFVKTYEKLSLLNSENDFLEGLADRLTIKFNNKVADIKAANPSLSDIEATKLAQEGLQDVGKAAGDRLSQVMGRKVLAANQISNPLQGIYATESYAKAIKNGLDLNFNVPDGLAGMAIKGYLGAKAGTQALKTVYNPSTHGRNVMGNVAMLIANGIAPDKKSIGTAMKATGSKLLGKNNRELAKEYARYTELGITNSGIGLSTVRANLNNVLKDPDKWLDKTIAGKGIKKTADLYQAEDDFFKIIHFEKTKKYLSETYPSADVKQIEEMAAQRTRDMMPNYRLVPKAIKAMRMAPVGDFISFPAEMIRTTTNLAKYTVKDLSDSAVTKFYRTDPSGQFVNSSPLFKAAALRLGGMTAIGAGIGSIAEATRNIYGISKEEDEAANFIGAPYNINQERIYLGPINIDKNGHKGVDYINMGPLDPYSYIKSAATITHDMLLSGEKMSDYQMDKLKAGLFEQTLSPFVAPSMITEAFVDLTTGYDRPTTDSNVKDGLSKLVNVLDPGVIRFFNKRADYEKSGMTKNLSTIVEGDVDLPAFLGLRRQRADFTAGVPFNLNSALGKIKYADKRYNKFIQNPNVDDPEEIMSEFKEIQKGRLEGFQDLKGMLELYKQLGYDTSDILKDYTVGERKRKMNSEEVRYVESAQQNKFIPTLPRETLGTYLNKTPIPMNEMIDLYKKLDGSEID